MRVLVLFALLGGGCTLEFGAAPVGPAGDDAAVGGADVVPKGFFWQEDGHADWIDGARAGAGADLHIALDRIHPITAADLNHDGFPDLVVAQDHFEDSFVYWGSSAGFSSGNRAALPTITAGGWATGDLNSDGFIDLVFSNASSSTGGYATVAQVFYGREAGFSTDHMSELAVSVGYAAAVADLDGDAFLDLVLTNYRDNSGAYDTSSWIYRGSAEGFSADNRDAIPTAGAIAVTIADMNADQRLDLVMSNSRSVTGDGDCSTCFELKSTIFYGGAVGFSSVNIAALPTNRAVGNTLADLNADGPLDVVFAERRTDHNNPHDSSRIYWGRADGPSPEVSSAVPSATAEGVAVADVDADGQLDLLVANHSDGSLDADSFVYYGQAGEFSAARRDQFGTFGVVDIGALDTDGDGQVEVFTSNYANQDDFNNPLGHWKHGSSGLEQVSALPTHGAGYMPSRLMGNISDRRPEFSYTSSVEDAGEPQKTVTLTWQADVPAFTTLHLQVRHADSAAALEAAAWSGQDGNADTWFTKSGAVIEPATPARFWQYRVRFARERSVYGPVLRSVTLAEAP